MQDLIAPTPKSVGLNGTPKSARGLSPHSVIARVVARTPQGEGLITRTRGTETAQAMGGCEEGPSVGARARSP